MVTYGVSFGVSGTLDPGDYDLYNSDPDLRVYPSWPNPTSGDQQKIDDLWHASINGRGEFLSAGNPEELVTNLQQLMQNVLSRIGSGASVSINGEELHAGTVMFQASYSTDGWTGDVKAYNVDTVTGEVILDAPLWSASHELGDELANANSSWDEPDWNQTDWDSGRLIATYDPSSNSGLPFRIPAGLSAGITDEQKNYLDGDADLAQQKLNYLRGDNANEEDNGGSFRNRSAKLGDLVHSSPLYQAYTISGVDKGVLFVGGNDGMLHAFDADDGHELFGYVPNLVFPNLHYLTNTDFVHRYFVDLTPYVAETGTTAEGGHGTLLVSGLGKGGKGYFCLDVSNPFDFDDEDELAAAVKWEYPRPSPHTSDAERDNMGFSFSKAFIVDSNDGWIVIFGNGYDSETQCAALYILDADTGALKELIRTGEASCSGSCNGLSTPLPLDVNGDYKVDYVYAGDLNGNIWKFDLSSSLSSEWKVAYEDSSGDPAPLFTAKGPGGTTQPITIMPSVMTHCQAALNGYLVLFGTGKYLHTDDMADTTTQTIYGIWDYGDEDDEYLGTFDRGAAPSNKPLSNQPDSVSLLQQEQVYYAEEDLGDYTRYLRVISNYEPVWETDLDANDPNNKLPDPSYHAGWYFDLPLSKERVVRDGAVRDEKYIVITSIPKDSPCAAGGDSIVHEMSACSGGRLDEAAFDITDDQIVNESDLIEIDNPDYDPSQPTTPSGTPTDPTGSGAAGGSGGAGGSDANPEKIFVAPTGIQYPSMMYPPVILRMPDEKTEMKYFSTAAGNITMLQETAEQRGMYYWKEIE